MGKKEPVSDKVDAPGGDGKDLVIGFQLQAQVDFEVLADLAQQPVQRRLIRGQENHVIQVAEIMPDQLFFFQPVVKIGQVKIGEVLRQVVADRKTRSAFDDLVEEPQ